MVEDVAVWANKTVRASELRSWVLARGRPRAPEHHDGCSAPRARARSLNPPPAAQRGHAHTPGLFRVGNGSVTHVAGSSDNWHWACFVRDMLPAIAAELQRVGAPPVYLALCAAPLLARRPLRFVTVAALVLQE